MSVMKRLLWSAAYAAITGLVNSALWAAEPAAGEKAVDGQSLADALLEVDGNENAWFRSAGLLAFSLELGIPEAKFREAHPGAQLDKLPAAVLASLRRHIDGIDAWSGCFGDERETHIVENDLFGGGSSKNAKKKTCEQAASVIVASLIPARLLADSGDDEAKNRELFAKSATAWQNRLRGKPADERMETWFKEADDGQRRLFLALAIQMSHSPAYPLLEAAFVERAKSADAFLYLELSAYFRRRRAKGKKLYGQLEPVLRKQPFKDGPPDEQEFFFEMWKLLTDYDTLDAAIADWQAGRLELSNLAELVERSIDQPWAYHSMGVEPVSVFRPTVEQNLKTLVASAVREQDLNRRVVLLGLASKSAHLLKVVTARSDDIEKRPAPRSDAAEWRQPVQQLRELFKDDRLGFHETWLTTPGEMAAGIVWELWQPEEQQYDAKDETWLRDWRRDALLLVRTARSLKIPAAEHFLTQPDGVQLEAYPEQQAAAIAAKFRDGNAAAWRKQLAALPWNEQLMLLAEMKRDPKLAFRMWPRLVEFIDWTGATKDEPASFVDVWRDKLAGKKLEEATWQALQDWIVAEARAGRYWMIAGETSPVRPGISLYILPTPPEARKEYAAPELRTHIQSDGISIYSRIERFRIAAHGLEEIVAKEDERPTTLPHPIRAIMEQNAKREGDQDLCNDGFTLRMVVVPPRRQESVAR